MQKKRTTPAPDALSRSFLAGVDRPVVDAIRIRAIVHHYRSGDIVVSESEPHWTGIVLAGLARVFLTTSGGRQVTVRHARTGTSIGIGALLDDAAVSAQAMTACDVLSLDTRQVRRLARQNVSLAYAIAEEASLRLAETYREVVIREQGTVRQRLARQLLSLAGQVDPRDPLSLPMSHAEIATAIGSAREVVTRHLAQLQSEEILALERGRIQLVDPVRLEATARQVE